MTRSLDDLVAPPPRPEFRRELRRRIASADRATRRRQRTAFLVAVAAAAVVVGAASVSAFRTVAAPAPVDRSYTCSVPLTGGVNRVDLDVNTRSPSTTFNGNVIPHPAAALFHVDIVDANAEILAGVIGVANGYDVESAFCRTGPRIPLARSGLRAVGTLRGNDGTALHKECWLAPTVHVRMHVRYAASGAPVAAQLALRSGAREKPALYVDWTPTKIAAYASAACDKP
ncbi:MAG TPA: hypothetical protein VFA30_03510 [Gaiellaceae bacterium]|nr:hypothetical protein [Gaiellaceae bacterium]